MSILKEDYQKMLSMVVNEKEFEFFLNSLNEEPIKGCTFNKKKVDLKDVLDEIKDSYISSNDSYIYYPYGTNVSKLPMYLSGCIYPMDFSAFSVCNQLSRVLKDKKNLKVLDLCSAPGGKTIGLSNLLDNISLIVSNDITYKRSEVLKTNIERRGIKNSVVTSCDPKNFLSSFSSYFDCVILDAPCSGSGMSRKKEKMNDDWSIEKVNECVIIQKDLIETAYELLSKDGILCYSTCSYSKEEDEEIIEELLKKHKDLEIIEMHDDSSLNGINNIGKRYIPGLYKGEGQFCCLIKKVSGEKIELNNLSKELNVDGIIYQGLTYKGIRRIIDYCPNELIELNPLKIGYALDDISEYSKCKYDWDASHFDGLKIRRVELDKEQTVNYFKGLEIKSNLGSNNELVILTYKGLGLGFGKLNKGKIKNYLPKGLRIQ